MFSPAAVLQFARLAVQHTLTESELLRVLRAARAVHPAGEIAVATVEREVSIIVETRGCRAA